MTIIIKYRKDTQYYGIRMFIESNLVYTETFRYIEQNGKLIKSEPDLYYDILYVICKKDNKNYIYKPLKKAQSNSETIFGRCSGSDNAIIKIFDYTSIIARTKGKIIKCRRYKVTDNIAEFLDKEIKKIVKTKDYEIFIELWDDVIVKV